MRKLIVVVGMLAISQLLAPTARADIFFVDAENSNLTVSVTMLGTTFGSQNADPRSLVTSYFGSIDATLSDPLSGGTSIVFNSSSVIANDSGSWVPDATGGLANPVLANYGLNAPNLLGQNIFIAMHDIDFNFVGNRTSQTLSFNAGYSDINAGALGDLLNNPLDALGLNSQTTVYTPFGDGTGQLIIPVNATFTTIVNAGPPFGNVDVFINFTGSIRAVSVPEPGSIAIVFGVLTGLTCIRRRGVL